MQKYIEKEFRLLEAYPEAIMNCSLNTKQQAKADKWDEDALERTEDKPERAAEVVKFMLDVIQIK
eukprot:scaffold37783_cov154-Skeletonema_marinoi.AAC.3